MRNILDKSCEENQNTHFMTNNIFFSENRAVYEIISKNLVEPDGRQMSQYGTYELHAGLQRLHARTRMSTPSRLGTRTHTHSQTRIISRFSTATMLY
jgi:hypothetical protein